VRPFLPFLPAPVAFDYEVPLVRESADPRFLVPLAAIGIVLGCALALRRRRPRFTFLVLWFFLILLPTSSLLYPINLFFADRFLHLAAVAPLALLAWGLVSASRRIPILAPVLVAVPILSFLFLSQRNLAAWESPRTLWAEVLLRSPESPHPRALHGYAEALARTPSMRDEAIPYLRRALELEPEYTTARGSLARLLFLRGDYAGAVREYRQLVEGVERRGIDPGNRADYVRACSVLADVYSGSGHGREAIEYAERLLAFRPRDAELRHGIGELYLEVGDVPVAKRYFEEALELRPGFAPSVRRLEELREAPGSPR
jgi:tetratricopeptide (TPR) repeat protein